jgi:rifampicin phosphotransferase
LTGKKEDGVLVLPLGAEGSEIHDRVGGKAANLSRLILSGFPVPPGFCVTTRAYSTFLDDTGLGEKVGSLAESIEFDDPAVVEDRLSEIAELILGAAIPKPISEAIGRAYADLGAATFVAVRSSGTAEDLAEASFAGLHDSFLDVIGHDDVIGAVQRCWASLWSPRAVIYRHSNGFDQAATRLAVVIQSMVPSEVSGVMFTANPLTTATDEVVINANWGLGESVVQGVATPDQFVVKSPTLRVLDRVLGSKEARVVRHSSGRGTVTEDVPERDRERVTLTDTQAGELARLGLRVQAHYEDFPQDIEWGLSDGNFHILQSRPITGVPFSWDADVEAGLWDDIPEDDETVWSRALADEFTTGAVCPLTYSVRYPSYSRVALGPLFAGRDYSTSRRMFKFHKAELYTDTSWARLVAERRAWPAFRRHLLVWANPQEYDAILAAPFNRRQFAWFLVRRILLDRHQNPYSAMKHFERYWRSEPVQKSCAGLTAQQVARLSDRELVDYIERQHGLEQEFGKFIVVPIAMAAPALMVALREILGRWYDGDGADVYMQLISGSTEQTDTQRENVMIWRLAQRIRTSEPLRSLFDRCDGTTFFSELETIPEGRQFMDEYNSTLGRFGHRGAADRDLVYPRREEDPSLDYRAFQALLGTDAPVDPELTERETNRRRQDTFHSVMRHIRAKRLGFLKALLFTRVYHLVHRLLAVRDNQRQNPTDLIMQSYKRGFVEMGRRLHARGLFDAPDDVHYLGKKELLDLFEGRPVNMKLLTAKIAGRRRDVERMFTHEAQPPKYLLRHQPLELELSAADGEGRWRGTPASPGTVTGTARVVTKLADIGRVGRGEILVAHATDPGWTPVFLLISGVVVEAGGTLSHAACLAREYGLPAVQLDKAMRLIPDGATIEVHGSTGTVTILGDTEAAATAP